MKYLLTTLVVSSMLLGYSGNAQPNRSPRPGQAGGPGASPLFNTQPIPNSDFERHVLAVLDDMNSSQRRGSMSVPVDDGRILRVLAESMGAKHVVELGTSIGYSGTWFCLALHHTGGKLTTYEIDPGRASQARANFKRAGVDHLVTLVEGDAHKEVANLEGVIDLVFLDADKEGYLDYLQKLLPKLRAGGLVVAHNMTTRQADPAFVKAITSNPNLETLFLNMESSGISVSLKKH